MRKLLCSLLLPLILLLTQQGAVVHALSHLGSGGSAAIAGAGPGVDTPEPPHSKDTLCALCLGLQHLAGWLSGPAATPALLDLAHVQATLTPPTWRDRSAPEARSRGPPLLL